jgi:hypothetical protein
MMQSVLSSADSTFNKFLPAIAFAAYYYISVWKKVGSQKHGEYQNPAGIQRIPLESQPLSAGSPLVGGVLDPRRHLSMQLLCGFDIPRMWYGFNPRKQPVYRGYQFPKRGFAVLPVFER